MPLSKRKRGEKPQLPLGVLSRLQLSPYRIRQAGLATEEITYRTLVRELRTVGTIEFDERRLSHITARTPGRIDRLFVDFTGTTIKKNDPLVWLYSPDLLTTQEQYLLAIRTLEELKTNDKADPSSIDRAQSLVDSTRRRLELWGITEDQIKNLEEAKKAQTHLKIHSPVDGTVIARHVLAGQYVTEGTELYLVADLSTVWMQAEVFERDMGLVKHGQAVEISSEAYPGETFTGIVAYIHPTLQAETRTVKVRVDVPNPQGKIKSGMYVTAVLRIPVGKQEEVFYGC